MEKCPHCESENVYYSKKRSLFVCEDCDNTFDISPVVQAGNTKQSNGLDLFFSYGHDKNQELVERIKVDLEQRGHHVWIDKSSIKAGESWREDILNGILKASNVIAFLSEYSTRDPGVCLDELKIALCVRGANIKTVLLEPEKRVHQPATLSDIQWLDMSNWSDMKLTSKEQYEKWYQEKFNLLCQSIESDEMSKLSGDIEDLKIRLSPYLDSIKEHHLLSKSYYGRKWLNDYINKWKTDPDSKSLIIYGTPGSGKSAFCVNFAHYNADVYGCFLCEWNREYSIDVNQITRTIAFRLATKLPDYRALLLDQLSRCTTDLKYMNDEALFDFLLTYPLTHLIDGNRESGIIIIDGLDEAEINGTNPLATIFSKCVVQLPRWIKFVFTSRPEKNITTLFKSTSSVNIVKDMPPEYNDIMAYLLHTLTDELQLVPDRMETLAKVCELSNGVFLYAELFVEDVKAGKINLSNTEEFPLGLGAFYYQSMQRRFPTAAQFMEVKMLLELLSVSDTIPESIIIEACKYTKYSYLLALDKLGSWVDRNNSEKAVLSLSHKSLSDWFTDDTKSGCYYVDRQHGALVLARYCKEKINKSKLTNTNELYAYYQNHIGQFYVLAGEYGELEDFLLSQTDCLNPYWKTWKMFPDSWDHTRLLNTFWSSSDRNTFANTLQREGNTALLMWMFNKAKEMYGLNEFDHCLATIYMDAVHISGNYQEAVAIADQLLQSQTTSQIYNSEFYSMLRIRKVHHSMFYKPVHDLIDDALSIYSEMSDQFPRATNELLFLLGGNLGVLSGDWEFAQKWLTKSDEFARKNSFSDYSIRNARKIADLQCRRGDYATAEKTILEYVNPSKPIVGRYENYLVGSLGNIYTFMGKHDEALDCFEHVLQYSSANGISGWSAHAYLGIANIHYKLNNRNEAMELASRANRIYKQIKQDWGIIMSGALIAACESEFGISPMKDSCQGAIDLAGRMQYNSCIESISNLCNHTFNCLMLLFL